MKSCPWMEALVSENFRLPITVKKDNQYFSTLNDKFSLLKTELANRKVPDSLIQLSKDYCDRIVSAINFYYKGDIIKSHSIIAEMIEDCCLDNDFAISHINDSIAFPFVQDSSKSEVQFFRARLNEAVFDYPAEEMLHIPFSKRSIVKSERFSIPGLPCLYLGNTSYVCWIEMGRPADFRFNVSPVVLDNTQKIFNLTVLPQHFYYVIDTDMSEEERIKKLCSLFKIYLLNFATSFNVLEENRNFKSEYIISQMIMLACKSKGLDGITYTSKRVEHEVFARVLGVNLVLLADFDGEESKSKICEHIENGDSFNYSMFKQLDHSLKYKDYDLRIDQSPFIANIGTFSRQFPYKETQFYHFDKYLFANWDRLKNKVIK